MNLLIKFSRFIEPVVSIISSPGARVSSSPPGVSDKYLDPKSPSVATDALVSLGSFNDFLTLNTTTALKVCGSTLVLSTFPIRIPLILTSVPSVRPSAKSNFSILLTYSWFIVLC